MDETRRERIALFRYGVISELVSQPLAPGEKERLLLAIADKEWEIPHSTRRHIGRTTARDWVAAYQSQGFEGLKPRPRSDKGSTRAISDSVQALLLSLRRERPKASVVSLIRAARLSGQVSAETELAPSTVVRLFEAHDLPTSSSTPSQPDAKAFTYPHVGDLWMSDVMHGPRLLVPGRRHGTKTYLHALIDDASRLVPYAAFYRAENSACFQDALQQGFQRRGLPRRLYCDNGAIYRQRHLQIICAILGISLMHSRPYQPRGRGKIERFFRHVRSGFLVHVGEQHLQDLATLNRVFWAWLEAEYHQTPHRSLQGQTPLERFCEDVEHMRQPPHDLELLMRMKVMRRVGRDRTVQLDGRLFEAPDGFAGEKVEILYNPYEPQRPVYMRRLSHAEEYRLRLLDLEANARSYRLPDQAEQKEEEAPRTGISYLDLIAQKHEEKP